MVSREMLDRFTRENPLTVLCRGVGNALRGEHLDAVFAECRGRQYTAVAPFSAVAVSMAEIALGTVANRNQAYHKFRDELGVSKVAYYGKTNRTEPAVSEGLVRDSAERAQALLGELPGAPRPVLPGYRVLVLDGNHLRKTHKRLKATRGLQAATLPGTVVARFDPQSGLFDRAYLLEDAHAQESTVLGRALADLGPRDVVVADRHFCVVWFLSGLARRGGFFAVRQHGRLHGRPLGRRRRVGRTATGTAYEQNLRIGSGGEALVVRRVTVELDEPTQDGDTEIHVLANLPEADADARAVAEIYRRRWLVENAFYLLTTTLTCETPSNGHPRCALLLFCTAMLAFNGRQVLQAALRAEHDAEQVAHMSQYQVALDVVAPMGGFLTAVDDAEWEALTPRDPAGLARFLRRVARHVDVASYRKSVRGPKRPPPPREPCVANQHVATSRLLEEHRQRC